MRLEMNKTARVVIGGSKMNSLVLQNVKKERAGNYTCGGKNSEGEGMSKAVSLNIMCEYNLFINQLITAEQTDVSERSLFNQNMLLTRLKNILLKILV